MDSALWGFIGTLVGVIVGAAASIGTTIISARNAKDLQSQSDALLRVERSRDFQRTNLLALQAHMEDTRAFQADPNPAKRPMLSDALDEEISKAARKLAILIERVSNDELREQLKKMRVPVFAMLDARTRTESEAYLHTAMVSYEKAAEAMGAGLRSYY
jgi:hypothetical protein